MATRQNTDYGFDIQKLYLEMMMTDGGTFVRCQTIFDHSLFDRKLQPVAEFINNYVIDHNNMPTFEMVNAATKFKLENPGTLQDEHYDWLLAEFETFVRHKGLEKAMLKGMDMLEEGNYGPVFDMVKEAIEVGLTKDIGTDYWANPKERLMTLKDKNGQVKTGWPNLDAKLYGGMNRGELNLFLGASGSGKSLFLANMGVNFALVGLNVMYITMELSEALVSMRIDAMTTGISTKELFKDIDNLDLKVKLIGKKSGAFHIKYIPSGKNTNDIKSYLKEYEVKTGNKIDVLLVDYMDLMMPINKKISASDLFVKDKYVAEELRNLFVEKNCIGISAVQGNRSMVEEVEFDHSHIAGGISKIQTADNVIGIFTNKAMRERGEYELQLMKTRSSSGVGQKIKLDFNVDTLRISDPETDDGIAAPKVSILDTIKRKTTDNPTDVLENGASVPKIKVQTDSTRLRQFLNDLPNDEP